MFRTSELPCKINPNINIPMPICERIGCTSKRLSPPTKKVGRPPLYTSLDHQIKEAPKKFKKRAKMLKVKYFLIPNMIDLLF
jgi:hypothetical protein